MSGGRDKWEKRYFKVVRRFGQGNKVEDLMIAITQDVQLIVNKHAVNSATPEQKAIIDEIKCLPSSMSEEKSSRMSFNTQRRGVLGGMGVAGKTQLTIAYAESRSRSYSSVFWMNTASEAALKDSFRSIAGLIFDVQDPRLLESKVIIGRVHQGLSDSTNTGWLLIFDNYDDLSMFDINEYYPPASHGAIMVTTRRPDLVAGEKRWNIDPRRPLQLQEYDLQLQEYEERTLYTTWDAYFNNQGLWYRLFHAGLSDSSPSWVRKIIADDVNLNGMMRILTECYFLEVEPALESWSMHNCVHDWTLAVLNKDINTQPALLVRC
ncbi:hypothetical protein N7471_010385 [Penicillium samsonianum]|uniref:uncharacterized protein n=1 Tax=Penicillium samsonianum TaxID=1882272 RepID=UPI0025474BA9|nr:uncharacterized protein N7471_010385 [Penicillium samsonianum]KAJ6125892.1 hypothetical protein N7471_010385 [Penicillium samsonianum]